MFKLFYQVIFVVVLLAACGEGKINQSQMEYLNKLHAIKNSLTELKTSRFIGRGENGGMLPENIDQLISDKQSELDRLHQNPPFAESWNAKITSLKREGSFVVINTIYGETWYMMKISDPVAKKLAEDLREDDEIQFSGQLMPERSKTSIGALIASEFAVYPTKVIRGKTVLTQSQQITEEGRSVEAKSIDDQKRASEASAKEEQLKRRVKQICQETILRNLKYPASAYFPTVIKQYQRGEGGSWIYNDVVSAKNELGADIPKRFTCTGRVEGDEVVVRVKYID